MILAIFCSVGSWQLIGLDINYLVYKMYQNSSQFSSQGFWSDNNTRGEGQTYPALDQCSAVSGGRESLSGFSGEVPLPGYGYHAKEF